MKKFLLAFLSLGVFPLAGGQQYMSARSLTESIQQHGSAGTSAEPASTPVPMLMRTTGPWMLMLHANVFAANIQQQANSPRNRNAFFSTNWVMPMAQRGFGKGGRGGLLTLRTMLSLEPGTMRGRQYPELFQQGETAFNKPIVDGQHPHDFFMEVAALYDLKLAPNTMLSFYAAPVGDPAIGPTAYPHRQSASEDPIAALGHHQQDSTHIAFDVFTGGLTYRWARVELSGFHGAEPTEAHWHFAPSQNGLAVDSVATRFTVAPTVDWSGQYSVAHIKAPESAYPGEDQQRQTASVMYHHTFRSRPASSMGNMAGMDMGESAMREARPSKPDNAATSASSATHDDAALDDMPGMDMSSMKPVAKPAERAEPPSAKQHNHEAMSKTPAMHMVPEPTLDLSVSAIWGRTKSLHDGGKQNSYLLEALLRFSGDNYAWTRMENAGRSNELLLTPGSPLPTGFEEHPLGHVAAFTFGYDHDIKVGSKMLMAPGVQFTAYRTPPALSTIYGSTPTSEVFFVRFRVR